MNNQTLDFLTKPIPSIGLIEASAGTGKTYSITWLYLRFVLEFSLPIEQILVVTFTDAATDELRERIRQRLIWARLQLVNTDVNRDNETPEEKNFQTLLTQCTEREKDRKYFYNLLSLALESFDQAAIFTIHGWCRRIIFDHALAPFSFSGQLEVDDDSPLKQQFVEDFWRRELHRDPVNGKWLLVTFSSPNELYKALKSFFSLSEDIFIPKKIEPDLESLTKERSLAINQVIKIGTIPLRESLFYILTEENNGLSKAQKGGYHPDKVKNALDALKEWIAEQRYEFPLPDELIIFTSEFFSASKLHNKKKKFSLPQSPLLEALLKLGDIEKNTKRLKTSFFLKQALLHVQQSLNQHEELYARLGYDALIQRVYDTLVLRNDKLFAEQLRKQYPVALIDEFQDTDQRQFSIFQSLYQNKGCLLMIGDAKQSIYRFRGGDVYVYGKARQLAEKNLYTLENNYRAEPVLTNIINKLFCGERNFICDFIHWKDVQGHGPKNGIHLTPNSSPLIIWHAAVTERLVDKSKKNDLVIASGKLESAIAEAVSQEIVGLLSQGTKYELMLGKKSVVAGDITILVNKHDQAWLVEQSLRKLGVSCTRLSRESIYATNEAQEMLVVLRALISPTKRQCFLAMLATELFGWSAVRIENLSLDIHVENQELEKLAELTSIWHRLGPVALIETLLHNYASTLLSFPDGERRIANLRHLAELLSLSFIAGHSPLDQLAMLERNMANADGENDLEQLQIDTDKNCVRIMTIHASKGLEFPIVFAPFLWQLASKRSKNPPVLCHVHEFDTVLDLGSDYFSRNVDSAESEEYAEAMRLTYVACTRAINRLYLVWGKIKGAEKSPMARLLHGISTTEGTFHSRYQQLSNEDIFYELNKFSTTINNGIAVKPMPINENKNQAWMTDSHEYDKELNARKFTANISEVRNIYSFSKFIHRKNEVDYVNHDNQLISSQEKIQNYEMTAIQEDNQPHGAQLGQCLHAILEEIDFRNSESNLSISLISKTVEQYGFDKQVETLLTNWIKNTLNAELLPGLRLSELSTIQHISEMEFHFCLNSAPSTHIQKLAERFPAFAGTLSILAAPSTRLEGWMHGYIDLALEHAGQYFIVDYKSNYLGNDKASYSLDRLAATMSAHNYDVQALIYEVALHRFLSKHFGNHYNARTMLGGSLYLFVRGIDRDIQGSGVYFRPAPIELILALDDWFGSSRII